MQSLAERQREFSVALLDASLPIPSGCVDPDRRADAKRFAVYRNNVVASLSEALRESFPAVCRLLGEEYFRALAPLYIARHPPVSPVMHEYGETFPAFLAAFEPLAPHPYLADVARIEWAWLEAYHAADVTPLDLARLDSIQQERAGDLVFTLHPSVRMVRSIYPALTIWRTNVGESAAQPTEPLECHPVNLASGGEDTLIARPRAEVEVHAMPPGAAALVAALARGRPLAEAAHAALCAHEFFNLAEHLEMILQSGWCVDCRLPARGGSAMGER